MIKANAMNQNLCEKLFRNPLPDPHQMKISIIDWDPSQKELFWSKIVLILQSVIPPLAGIDSASLHG